MYVITDVHSYKDSTITQYTTRATKYTYKTKMFNIFYTLYLENGRPTGYIHLGRPK